MAWDIPFTATSGDTLTAAVFNAEVRNNLLETEVAKAFESGRMIISSATNTVAERRVYRDSQLQVGDRTSSSYGDLDAYVCTDARVISQNFGPAVTLTTGTTAVAWYSARMGNASADAVTAYSVAVEDDDGTEYVAASDQWAGLQDGLGAAATGLNQEAKYGVCHRFTGLTAGTNSFIMKYHSNGSTAGSFSNRELFVMAL